MAKIATVSFLLIRVSTDALGWPSSMDVFGNQVTKCGTQCNEFCKWYYLEEICKLEIPWADKRRNFCRHCQKINLCKNYKKLSQCKEWLTQWTFLEEKPTGPFPVIETNNGPGHGNKCAFPFFWDGRWHSKCIPDKSNKQPWLWCSIETDEDGKFLGGLKWGYCPEAMTKDNVPCVFPFTYSGQTYEACTEADSDGKPWCSTEVDDDGNHITGKDGLCNICTSQDFDEKMIKDNPSVAEHAKLYSKCRDSYIKNGDTCLIGCKENKGYETMQKGLASCLNGEFTIDLPECELSAK